VTGTGQEHDPGGLLIRVAAEGAPVGGGGRQGAVARKRGTIVAAATRLFLDHGFVDTSTDQIAAAAAVSKQTVYNQFGDKEALFREVVLGVAATAEQFADLVAETLDPAGDPDAVARALHALARQYVRAVADPQVLALRRMVIGEVHRFPELAATYHQRSPTHVLEVLAAAFARLTARGLLAADDPPQAADHFAHLVVGPLLDRGMFHQHLEADPSGDATRAARGVEVFLAAYGVAPPS
jgi:TetR/AcrR family transcriptional repressor of mexJK operon